jgi:hypothetical protein
MDYLLSMDHGLRLPRIYDSRTTTFFPDRFSGQYCFVIFGVAVMRLPSLSISRK